MILIEFLFAPTVPSAPRPKNTARTVLGRFDAESRRRPSSDKLRHVVDDADGEMRASAPGRSSSSNTALAIAGVNSFEPRP